MPGLYNRAQMAVSGTPGTGAITLGSPTAGFQTLAAAGVSDGELVSYLLTDGNAWELGIGTYSASGTTLARTAIRESSAGGAAINASSAAIVSIVALAEDYFAAAVPPLNANVFQTSQMFLGSGGGTIAVTANTIYAVPFINARRQTITRLVYSVSTAAASTEARAGIYNDAGGRPGRLVVDGGTISTASTGDKVAAVNVDLRPGLYWLLFVANGGPTIRGYTSTTALLGVPSTNPAATRYLSRTLTYGALPADESGATYALTAVSSACPAVYLQQ